METDISLPLAPVNLKTFVPTNRKASELHRTDTFVPEIPIAVDWDFQVGSLKRARQRLSSVGKRRELIQ